jgi:hypothetical protein
LDAAAPFGWHGKWRVGLVGRLVAAYMRPALQEVIMDKAAIFADVTRRNALRRANKLPPLDIRAEYDHQVAVAKQRDYQAFCDRHADEREAIRLEVLAELRLQNGPDFGTGMGGRWMVGRLTHQRFVAHIAEQYGVHPGRAGRNEVKYGGASKKDA